MKLFVNIRSPLQHSFVSTDVFEALDWPTLPAAVNILFRCFASIIQVRYTLFLQSSTENTHTKWSQFPQEQIHSTWKESNVPTDNYLSQHARIKHHPW